MQEIFRSIFGELKKKVSLWEMYPEIRSEEDLCAYYKKQNKSIPGNFLFFGLGFLSLQIIRSFFFLFERDPWAVAQVFLKIWIIFDTIIFTASLYFFSLQVQISLPEARKDLKVQIAARRKLRVCAFIPTLGYTAAFIKMVETPLSDEMLGLIWISMFVFQLHSCAWLADGTIYRTFLIGIFNIAFVYLAKSKGKMKDPFYPAAIFPIFLAFLYFVFHDWKQKENFMLKRNVKKQKQVYENFLQKLQDPIVIVTEEKISFFNHAATTVLGVEGENFYHKTRLAISNKGQPLSQAVKERFKSPQDSLPIEREKFYLKKEESEIVSYDNVLIVSSVEASHLTHRKTIGLILRDITAELKEEQQAAEVKFKNMLLFSLSHELRTPLNILQGFLRIAKRLVTAAKDRAALRGAKGAWITLRNKISDVLDYAQILSEDFVLRTERFSLRLFVRYFEKVISILLQDKKEQIQLKFRVEDTIPMVIDADRERIEQVLFNLLTNAVKFTNEGSIELNVKKARHVPGMIIFEVTDTGCGMSQEAIQKLFQLKQTQSSEEVKYKTHMKKATGLSGLGLTVSRMICKKLYGDINVRSKVGEGSCFSFSILLNPVPQIESDTISEVREEEAKPKAFAVPKVVRRARLASRSMLIYKDEHINNSRRSGSMKEKVSVLIVDDTDLNRFVAKSMIEKYGFNVVEAHNGREALTQLASLQESAVDDIILVFMDLDMPVMDGIESTIAIRAINKQPRPYIAALTAFASQQERVKCLEVGMDNFLSKPLTKESLRNLLMNLTLID